jgi:flagella basal body P-ring formation protein FlgA
MSLSKRRPATLFGSAVLLLLFVAGAWAGEGLEVKVREDVTVRGGTVTLGHIATFTPESDSRVDGLSRIEVASAPSPGNAVSLNRSFLQYKIGAAVSGKGDDIRLEIPPAVSVRRSASIVSSEQLERIFKEHVRTHSAWDPEKMEFEKMDVPESVALPEGKVRWEIWDRGSDRYLGHVALTINFFVDGKQVRNVPVSGKVTLRQAVVRAARKIGSGQVVSREDVQLVHEQSVQLQRDVLTVLEDAIGKKAVRSIQAGQPIGAQMLEDPPVVKKGNRVLIVAANDLIRVSTSGKAVEDGRMGEEVRVVNLSSGKEIYATVTGPGTVEVSF